MAAPVPAPAPVVVAAPAPAPAAAALGAEGITDLLLGIVEDRTGYPRDMLGMDQGIEADLGIDSIKRLEIVGALIKALPPAQAAVAQPIGEELNAQKTLGAIVAKLVAHLAGGATGGAAAPFDPAGVEHADLAVRPPRHVTVPEYQPLPPGGRLPPGRYLITEDAGGLAALVAARRWCCPPIRRSAPSARLSACCIWHRSARLAWRWTQAPLPGWLRWPRPTVRPI
jgi:hypothetical protein